MTDVAEVLQDEVTARSVQALHDLLGASGPAPGGGDPVPPLWHWLAFLPRSPQSELQVDGHVPAASTPTEGEHRRMFAGGRLEFVGDLRVGRPLVRSTTFSEPVVKEGRSGRLVFVTVRHEISCADEPAVIEEQDLVYRPVVATAGPGASTPAPASTAAPDEASASPPAELERVVVPDSRMLFRFSALTYNAHRIHYDLPYATGVEGYPGLVVHGPLQAILLAELLRAEGSTVIKEFRFRGVAPAFVDAPLRLRGERSGRTVELASIDPAGTTTMSATVTLGES